MASANSTPQALMSAALRIEKLRDEYPSEEMRSLWDRVAAGLRAAASDDLPGGPTDPERIAAAVTILDSVNRDPTPTEREMADVIRRARAALTE